ncbi:HupE/UreJ family protein [Labilibaculum sp.]|uniref:HupE/UreJ family protein n=1 Tax=Labilibaculum sp. TaxID=2060723 RepID=UPI002AA6656F|nr:HupE/UreJ family protein [Labilibaculum sp.]MBN2598569.1 HupE/UreJ family protein [Marinifilaceae bacterium]
MNTILSSFESAFYHLIYFSSFEPFMLLVLFGITFQLKDWKAYFSLLLALVIGSIAGLLLCNFSIINFSGRTVKLILAISILMVGIQNLISGQGSASTIKYNFFALIGIVLGIGINLHYKNVYGSSFSLYPFTGYNLGASVSYFLISFCSLLLSSLLMLIFKTDRKSFNLVITGIGIGIALVLIYLRY